MSWWQYLLLVNVYLVLFYGFYALLLRRETFFQLNRIYLVSAALLSFFIPMIQANWVKNLFITQRVEYTLYGGPLVVYNYKPVERAPVNIGEVLAVLYFAGVLFLALRFIWQLMLLNKTIKKPGQAAFSFFNKIRLDETANNSDIIIAHEQVHAKQWHSADVLAIEAVMIINWFNPIVYFYRRAIKHLHEFIADSQATKASTNKADYALLLLSQTFSAPVHGLVNHFFNHSLLKQRIIMLQKNKSQRIKLVKYGLSAPLFILMLILSSATVNNSKTINIINKKAAQVFAMPAEKIILSPVLINNKNAKPAATTIISNTAVTDKKIDHDIANETDKGKEEAEREQTDTVPKVAAPIFAAVEVEPTFSGTGNSFGQFLAKEIRYPAIDRRNNIQGRVIITFVVEKDGSLSNIKAVRSPSETLAAEAVRVISLSPKWNPGIQNGSPVRTQFTLPINFALSIDSNPAKPDTVRTNKGWGFIGKPMVNALVILDGKEVKYNDLKLIDANSIKSVSILKDKDATSLYGAKGANGVIVVTTKSHN